jgi:hypothetical protein
MMKFWSSGDGTGSRVKNKLETIDLSSRKIERERVAVVNLRVNERRSNSRGSRANTIKYAVDQE